MSTVVRLSADDRRRAVIAAATVEFAVGGYEGTSAEVIARRAKVSQPYLFQLFGTKKGLFLAVVQDAFARTIRHFALAAQAARIVKPESSFVLEAIGNSYGELIADRNLLLLQLHSYAACADPEIRSVVRSDFAAVYRAVASLSGADPAALESWFARGVFCTVATAMGLSSSEGGATALTDLLESPTSRDRSSPGS